MDKTNQQSVNSGSSISSRIPNEDRPPKISELNCQKIKIRSKSFTSSLIIGLFAVAIANLLIASSESSSRAITWPSQKYSDRHHYSVYLTLVLLDINHHFARCSTLPMIEFSLKKIEFEGKVCSLTTYLLVHRFNKH